MQSQPNATGTKASAVTQISFSSEHRLAWQSLDGSLREWLGGHLGPKHDLRSSGPLSYTATALITTTEAPARVRHLDAQTLAINHVTQHQPAPSTILAVTSVPIRATTPPAPPGAFALLHDACIRVHAFTGLLLSSMPQSTTVITAVFSHSARLLATGDHSGTLRLHDVQTAQQMHTHAAHTRTITSLAFTDDDAYLLSTGLDGRLVVTDTTTCKPASRARPDAPPASLHAVATAASFVTAAGDAAVVRVWRLEGGELGAPIATHADHSSAVHALAISPCGARLATGCADGTVRLISLPGATRILTADTEAGEQPDRNHLRQFARGSASGRQLLFCPSQIVSLSCPICTHAYNNGDHKPVVSGHCGHTFGCTACNKRLWRTDDRPKCPVCRTALTDVAPNYELVNLLTDTSAHPPSEPADRDYIALRRLHWLEDSSAVFIRTSDSITLAGVLDGSPAAIRLPARLETADMPDTPSTTERHLQRAREVRGRHIAQLYGISRASPPDNRLIIVMEMPRGATTLATMLCDFRSAGTPIPLTVFCALGAQIVRTVRGLHEAGLVAGKSIWPGALAVETDLRSMAYEWGAAGECMKLMDLGGMLSRSELARGARRGRPEEFVRYLAPEMLDDGDTTAFGPEDGDKGFDRACAADMYAVGMVLWQVAACAPPFEGLSCAQIVGMVVGRDERPGAIPDWLPFPVRGLMARLGHRDPRARPDVMHACRVFDDIPSAPSLIGT